MEEVMKLVIEKCLNGFILTSEDGREVIMESDSEVKDYQRLLYAVLEHYGYFGSKHDAERLFIEVRKQNGK